MSKRAYDEDGQHFPVPAGAAGWRIRRFKNPGKPGGAQVVYGTDSRPLYLDTEATAAELQAALGRGGGRYRIDAPDVVDGLNEAHEESET